MREDPAEVGTSDMVTSCIYLAVRKEGFKGVACNFAASGLNKHEGKHVYRKLAAAEVATD